MKSEEKSVAREQSVSGMRIAMEEHVYVGEENIYQHNSVFYFYAYWVYVRLRRTQQL